MNVLELIKNGFVIVFTLQNLLLLIVGVIIGIIAGSIPGLSAGNVSAMMLPMTVFLPMETALIFISAVYMACQYGGSISAILINTPGAPGAIATTLDGFPLNQQGKAGYALGLSLGASTFGGLVATLIAVFLMKPISSYALSFNTADLFLTSLLGIGIIVSVSEKQPSKGGLAGAIGLLIAAMPAEPILGNVRLSFGFLQLYDGIPLTSSMCGFFAFPSMIALIGCGVVASSGRNESIGIPSVLNGVKKALQYPITLIRSTVIGLVTGIIPAAGDNIAALLSYGQAQTWSKNSGNFGHGEPEGVVAPEASNNACTSGALVPTMVLGIPGSATTAVMLAALTLHGVTPGPKVIQNYPNQVYSVFVSLFLATVLMFVLGLIYTAIASRLSTVNMAYVIPAVLSVCMVGTFATRGYMFDAFMFLIFGVLGYIMTNNGYAYAPLVLGIVMGQLAESNFDIAFKVSNGSFGIFFSDAIAIVIWLILVVAIVVPIILKKRKQKKEQPVE